MDPPLPATFRHISAAANLSRDEFVQRLNDSGLWSRAECDRNLKELAGTETAADGAALAEFLTTAGKLTPFQVEAICEQRYSDVLIGNYEVLDRLGAGAMGTVYKARHRRMNRVVGIKVLAKGLGQTPSFVQRFQREVEAVARLSHPNIVMAFDADEAEAGHFFVMEFVNGRDLATEVQEYGPLSVRVAVNCVLQAAKAMEYAHSLGIVHRDIKPANLLRDESGVVKVADLGLARIGLGSAHSGDSASSLTQAGGILGTADYMPPEQAIDSTTIDHRADIYSLGCTLYYLLTGRSPFAGATLMEILLKHRDAQIPSLCQARQGVPPALDAAFQRMVAKQPGDRFQTMGEVAQALELIEPLLDESADSDVLRITPAGVILDAEATECALAATDQTIVMTQRDVRQPEIAQVLLVEPSRTQSAIIRQYLQSQGVQEVVAVASGQEALGSIRKDRPDVVVSALHLSDMTGVELAQRIRNENPGQAPGFVLISSEAESAEAGSLSQCGRAMLLHKPFTPEQLAEALNLVADRQAAPAAEARQRNLRVLVVDDSAAARLHVRDVLKRFGIERIAEAADGAKAVSVLVGETFDLIVTDYNMPYMDGCGLVGYLKQNPATASIPIIMVTTEQDIGKLAAVRQLGVAAICDKSFPVDVVRRIIDQVVQRA